MSLWLILKDPFRGLQASTGQSRLVSQQVTWVIAGFSVVDIQCSFFLGTSYYVTVQVTNDHPLILDICARVLQWFELYLSNGEM